MLPFFALSLSSVSFFLSLLSTLRSYLSSFPLPLLFSHLPPLFLLLTSFRPPRRTSNESTLFLRSLLPIGAPAEPTLHPPMKESSAWESGSRDRHRPAKALNEERKRWTTRRVHCCVFFFLSFLFFFPIPRFFFFYVSNGVPLCLCSIFLITRERSNVLPRGRRRDGKIISVTLTPVVRLHDSLPGTPNEPLSFSRSPCGPARLPRFYRRAFLERTQKLNVDASPCPSFALPRSFVSHLQSQPISSRSGDL